MKITNLAEDVEDFTGEVWHIENKGRKALIDAGEGDCWNQIKELNSLEKVVITHSHHDHVKNLSKIVQKFKCKVKAFKPGKISEKAEKIIEGDKINLAGLDFEVMHTPGHKNDSICLYNPENKVMFTGDLIFPEGGFGRTDLAEGDRHKLIESINKIRALEVEKFYAGHGEAVIEDANKWIEKSLEEAKKHEAKY